MQGPLEKAELSIAGSDGNLDTIHTNRPDLKWINEERFYVFEAIVHFLQIEKENPLLGNVEHLPPLKVKIKFLDFPDIEINEEDFINNKNDFLHDENMSRSSKTTDLFPDLCKQLEGVHEEGFVRVNRLKLSPQIDLHVDHEDEDRLKIDMTNVDLSGKSLIFTMTPKQLIASIQKSPVSVTVFRYINANYEADPASKVGEKWISLPEDFCTTVLKSSNMDSPKATLIKKYEVQNAFNEKTGTIILSFRLCCFGSTVVTQVQTDYVTQEYNFKYLSNHDAFKCYNQAEELEHQLEKTKIKPLLTDTENVLDIKKDFVTTTDNSHVEKPVNWKAYNNQFQFTNWNDAQMDRASKIKNICTKVLPSGAKCECANILEGMYKKSKPQKIPLLAEEKQQNLNILKSRGTGSLGSDTKPVTTKRPSKLSIRSKQSKQGIAVSAKKKADMNKLVPDINEQTEKAISISPQESVPLNQSANITDPTIHTTMISKRRASSASGTLQKTDRKQETKIGKSLKRKRYFFDYSTGAYPGVRFGHGTCLDGPKYVPKTMGWLWNIPDQVTGRTLRRGWKPGVISKTIGKMIKATKEQTVSKGQLAPKKVHSSKRTMVLKTIPPTTTVSEVMKKVYNSDEEISPTLQLYKKGKVYCIQMNTIKEDSEDEQDPVKFKVVPDDDDKSVKTSKSSVAVRFVAPGALYRKPIKPDVAEVCTQYSEMNFGIEEILPPKDATNRKGRKEKYKKKGSRVSLSASNKSKRIIWDDSAVPTEISKF